MAIIRVPEVAARPSVLQHLLRNWCNSVSFCPPLKSVRCEAHDAPLFRVSADLADKDFRMAASAMLSPVVSHSFAARSHTQDDVNIPVRFEHCKVIVSFRQNPESTGSPVYHDEDFAAFAHRARLQDKLRGFRSSCK